MQQVHATHTSTLPQRAPSYLSSSSLISFHTHACQQSKPLQTSVPVVTTQSTTEHFLGQPSPVL